MKHIRIKHGRPRTTVSKGVRELTKNYAVEVATGRVFNRHGVEVGSCTEEPRVTIHLTDKNGRRIKYGIRTHKVVAFCVFGVEALRLGVSVRHRDKDRYNNSGSNLYLHYNKTAQRNYNRLQAAA